MITHLCLISLKYLLTVLTLQHIFELSKETENIYKKGSESEISCEL